MFDMFPPDRTQYPATRADGTLDIDLTSGKYLKLWQGPNHPGITGNMSVELTVCGDEVVEGKTHVGYLHRGFDPDQLEEEDLEILEARRRTGEH